jgi:hypothetical protein
MVRVSWTGNFPRENSGERARQGVAFTDTREKSEGSPVFLIQRIISEGCACALPNPTRRKGMPGNYPLFAQATNHAKSKPEKIRYRVSLFS